MAIETRPSLSPSAPAPDTASEPRCIKCQLVAQPSTAEHWPIGDTMMRFGKVTDRSLNGENRTVFIGRAGE